MCDDAPPIMAKKMSPVGGCEDGVSYGEMVAAEGHKVLSEGRIFIY